MTTECSVCLKSQLFTLSLRCIKIQQINKLMCFLFDVLISLYNKVIKWSVPNTYSLMDWSVKATVPVSNVAHSWATGCCVTCLSWLNSLWLADRYEEKPDFCLSQSSWCLQSFIISQFQTKCSATDQFRQSRHTKNLNQLDMQKPSNVVCFVYAELCWALTPGLSRQCCFLICWMFSFSSVDHHQDNLCDNRLTLQFPFLIFIFRICSDLSAAQCCQTGISCSFCWVE